MQSKLKQRELKQELLYSYKLLISLNKMIFSLLVNLQSNLKYCLIFKDLKNEHKMHTNKHIF